MAGSFSSGKTAYFAALFVKMACFSEDDRGASKMPCFSEDDTCHLVLGVKIGKAES
jgi:hypothetical protein